MKYRDIILVAVLVVAVAIVTNTSAYMRKETTTVNNNFVPAIVDCVINETFTDNVKSSIMVQNTSDVPAYIRLRVVSYWVDENGAIQHEQSDSVQFNYDVTNWIKDTDNDTYYYTGIVDVDAQVELLKASYTLTTKNNLYQVVDIFAEAIQADPADAVIAAWNVDVNSSGNIIKVN